MALTDAAAADEMAATIISPTDPRKQKLALLNARMAEARRAKAAAESLQTTPIVAGQGSSTVGVHGQLYQPAHRTMQQRVVEQEVHDHGFSSELKQAVDSLAEDPDFLSAAAEAHRQQQLARQHKLVFDAATLHRDSLGSGAGEGAIFDTERSADVQAANHIFRSSNVSATPPRRRSMVRSLSDSGVISSISRTDTVDSDSDLHDHDEDDEYLQHWQQPSELDVQHRLPRHPAHDETLESVFEDLPHDVDAAAGQPVRRLKSLLHDTGAAEVEETISISDLPAKAPAPKQVAQVASFAPAPVPSEVGPAASIVPESPMQLAAQASGLPLEEVQRIVSEWRHTVDSTTGRSYYYNKTTLVRSWQPPVPFVEVQALIPSRGSTTKGADTSVTASRITTHDATHSRTPPTTLLRPPPSVMPSAVAPASKVNASSVLSDSPVNPRMRLQFDSVDPTPAKPAAAAAPALAVSPARTSKDGSEWRSAVSTAGRVYYYNKRTREARWTLPEGVSSPATGARASVMASPSTRASTDVPLRTTAVPATVGLHAAESGIATHAELEPELVAHHPETSQRAAQESALHQAMSPGTDLDQEASTIPERVPCVYCHRLFAKDRLERHANVCTSVWGTKRPTFDAQQYRTRDTPLEQYQACEPCPNCGKAFSHPEDAKLHAVSCKTRKKQPGASTAKKPQPTRQASPGKLFRRDSTPSPTSDESSIERDPGSVHHEPHKAHASHAVPAATPVASVPTRHHAAPNSLMITPAAAHAQVACCACGERFKGVPDLVAHIDNTCPGVRTAQADVGVQTTPAAMPTSIPEKPSVASRVSATTVKAAPVTTTPAPETGGHEEEGRLVACAFCEVEIPLDDFDVHIRSCPVRKTQQQNRSTHVSTSSDQDEFEVSDTFDDEQVRRGHARDELSSTGDRTTSRSRSRGHEELSRTLVQKTTRFIDSRQPCPHCGRKFGPGAAERHVDICRNVVNKPSPPPTNAPRGSQVVFLTSKKSRPTSVQSHGGPGSEPAAHRRAGGGASAATPQVGAAVRSRSANKDSPSQDRLRSKSNPALLGPRH